MSYFLDKSAVEVVQNIAEKATQVYASEFGAPIEPDKHAIRIEQKEVELSRKSTG
jgi:hypothetical protein